MSDTIRRYETAAPAPSRADFLPAPIKYTADSSSPSAAINTVREDAANGNMLNNMHGGWITSNRSNRSNRHNKCRYRNSTINRGGRGRCGRCRRRNGRCTRRRSRRQGPAFKTRVSRRLRIRMVQRRIKKRNASSGKLQLHYGGGGGSGSGSESNTENAEFTVPQHGNSCGQGELNCAGNEAAILLATKNQMTANAHGDTV